MLQSSANERGAVPGKHMQHPAQLCFQPSQLARCWQSCCCRKNSKEGRPVGEAVRDGARMSDSACMAPPQQPPRSAHTRGKPRRRSGCVIWDVIQLTSGPSAPWTPITARHRTTSAAACTQNRAGGHQLLLLIASPRLQAANADVAPPIASHLSRPSGCRQAVQADRAARPGDGDVQPPLLDVLRGDGGAREAGGDEAGTKRWQRWRGGACPPVNVPSCTASVPGSASRCRGAPRRSRQRARPRAG